MDNRRRRGQGFAIFLTVMFALLFIAILVALIFGKPPAETETLIGGWGGTILAILGTAAAYEWGSSKGSAMKDELAAANAGPKAPPPNPPEPAPAQQGAPT